MVLMTIAFLGTVGFGAKMVKDTVKGAIVESECGGGIEHPSNITSRNKDILKNRRKVVYDSLAIPYDKNGNPKNLNNLNKIEHYLKREGYTEEEVKWFIDFTKKQHKIYKKDDLNEIKQKHQRILKKWRKKGQKRTTFTKQVYGTNYKIDERMEKLMENKLWGAMTQHYTNDGSSMEYWTMNIPVGMSNRQLQKLYDEVCHVEGVYNGF